MHKEIGSSQIQKLIAIYKLKLIAMSRTNIISHWDLCRKKLPPKEIMRREFGTISIYVYLN